MIIWNEDTKTFYSELSPEDFKSVIKKIQEELEKGTEIMEEVEVGRVRSENSEEILDEVAPEDHYSSDFNSESTEQKLPNKIEYTFSEKEKLGKILEILGKAELKITREGEFWKVYHERKKVKESEVGEIEGESKGSSASSSVRSRETPEPKSQKALNLITHGTFSEATIVLVADVHDEEVRPELLQTIIAKTSLGNKSLVTCFEFIHAYKQNVLDEELRLNKGAKEDNIIDETNESARTKEGRLSFIKTYAKAHPSKEKLVEFCIQNKAIPVYGVNIWNATDYEDERDIGKEGRSRIVLGDKAFAYFIERATDGNKSAVCLIGEAHVEGVKEALEANNKNVVTIGIIPEEKRREDANSWEYEKNGKIDEKIFDLVLRLPSSHLYNEGKSLDIKERQKPTVANLSESSIAQEHSI